MKIFTRESSVEERGPATWHRPGIPFMNESDVDLFGVWKSNKTVPGPIVGRLLSSLSRIFCGQN
jgi:hypothetical protein